MPGQRSLLCMLVFAVTTAGCGGGDDPASHDLAEPLALEMSGAGESQYVSVAVSLAPPAATESPLVQAAPLVPNDGPPPRVALAHRGHQSDVLVVATPALDRLPPPTLLRRTLLTKLRAPTDLAFASDGLLFYSERTEGLYVWRPGRPSVPVYSPLDVRLAGQGLGMLSVAVDPEFERNRFVYTLCVTVSGERRSVRVARLTLAAQSTGVVEHHDLVLLDLAKTDWAPASLKEPQPASLRFGPDGHLYVVAGQVVSSGVSRILRIDRHGHPRPSTSHGAEDPRIYASGLNGSVAVGFHPSTEQVLVGRRGDSQPDEMLMLAAHANAQSTRNPVSVWKAGMAGEGLSAIERLRGEQWGYWRNALVVAFDRAQRLQLIKLNADGRVQHSVPLLQKAGVGFRAVANGPDGLYVLTTGKKDGDELWRLDAM